MLSCSIGELFPATRCASTLLSSSYQIQFLSYFFVHAIFTRFRATFFI